MEDKYVLEFRSEVLDVSILCNGFNYGVVYENFVLFLMILFMFVLYYYYLVFVNLVLVDMNEEQIGNIVMFFMFIGDGFNFIMENMDVECMGSGNFNLNEFEYYLVLENDFSG